MSNGTNAVLMIDSLPELGADAVKYTVDCRWATTTMAYVPGALDLAERHLVSVLLQRHEAECSKCNLAPLWRLYGDVALKSIVDRAWERMGQSEPSGRRN